jgi:hypothetical protein
MSSPKRTEMLALIQRNIEEHGFHIYLVFGVSTPRFAYTIGLGPSLGAELLLAGALYYGRPEVSRILHAIRERLRDGASPDAPIPVAELGTFTLRQAHRSWTRELMLGALDHYSVPDVDAWQVVPDAEHHTLDVPDLAQPWSAATEPPWQWLHEPWPYAVPVTSTAVTHLPVLRGAPITVASRWEPEQWEIFAADPDAVPDDEVRLVPLGLLLAADSSLRPAAELEVGAGIERAGAAAAWESFVLRNPDEAS